MFWYTVEYYEMSLSGEVYGQHGRHLYEQLGEKHPQGPYQPTRF